MRHNEFLNPFAAKENLYTFINLKYNLNLCVCNLLLIFVKYLRVLEIRCDDAGIIIYHIFYLFIYSLLIGQ